MYTTHGVLSPDTLLSVLIPADVISMAAPNTPAEALQTELHPLAAAVLDVGSPAAMPLPPPVGTQILQ